MIENEPMNYYNFSCVKQRTTIFGEETHFCGKD